MHEVESPAPIVRPAPYMTLPPRNLAAPNPLAEECMIRVLSSKLFEGKNIDRRARMPQRSCDYRD